MSYMKNIGLKGLCLAATLCSAQVASATSDELNYPLNSDIRSVYPGGHRDNNTDFVAHTIYEGLVGFRTDLSVGAALASGWTVSEDGKTYTFTLRDGVKFHNGDTMVAADVVASWDRLAKTEDWKCAKNFFRPGGLNVTDVTAPDDSTVTFQLENANGLFLKELAGIQCQVLVAHEDSWNADGSFNMAIGTGPFKMANWARDERISLVRFDDYVASTDAGDGYAGKREALVERLNFLIIPDSNATLAALESGAVDIANISFDDVEKMESLGMHVAATPGLSWATLLVQTQDPLMGNKMLRQAIAHAIDYEQLAEAVSGGLAKANNSAVNGTSTYYSDAFSAWPEYDPAKAAALAKEAGYNGEEIKIQTNKKYNFMYDDAVILQAMLVGSGFNAKLEVLDWATQLDNYLSGNFQMQSFGYSARFDPGLLFGAIVGDKSKAPYRQWDNPEAIEMLVQSGVSTDDATRGAIFAKLHRMMADEVPIIPLYFIAEIKAVRPEVKGFSIWAGSTPILWNVSKD